MALELLLLFQVELWLKLLCHVHMALELLLLFQVELW